MLKSFDGVREGYAYFVSDQCLTADWKLATTVKSTAEFLPLRNRAKTVYESKLLQLDPTARLALVS
jgi:hypothetical protein